MVHIIRSNFETDTMEINNAGELIINSDDGQYFTAFKLADVSQLIKDYCDTKKNEVSE